MSVESERLPDEWDDVAIRDGNAMLAEACDPEVARPLIASRARADHLYENARSGAGAPQQSRPVDEALLRKATAQMRKHQARLRTAVEHQLSGINVVELLGAIAILGAIPDMSSADRVSIPGSYDREIEWLATLTLTDTGRTPTWGEVIDVLCEARRYLLVDFATPTIGQKPLSRLREHAAFAANLGSSYAPIARELTVRLLSQVQDHPAVRGTYLDDFVAVTDRLFDDYVHRILDAVVEALAAFAGPRSGDRKWIVGALMSHWDVAELVEHLTLPSANNPCGAALTTPLEEVTASGGDALRSRPLLEVRPGSALLLFAARIACDRHDILDRAIETLLRSTPRENYSDLRASMLDGVIADAVSRLLPGCEVHEGKNWIIDGKLCERDVVVLYEDIALCIETKAPRFVASRYSRENNVVDVLRGYMKEGVRQAQTIADALETGDAYLAEEDRPIRRVRRAYRLVASFNSWWGIDADIGRLTELAVLPSADAAMLTSADMFACHELLFEEPADFIGYLDQRLSLQRRPWVVVSDEYELIGGYFTNPHYDWTRRPVAGAQIVVKPSFQHDITATIRFAKLGRGRRPSSLMSKHRELVDRNRRAWVRSRPLGWLQAFSAASRLPASVQNWLEETIAGRRRRGVNGGRIVLAPDQACALIFVREGERWDQRAWQNTLSKVRPSVPLVAVRVKDRQIVAIRGLDDEDAWIDPLWDVTDSRR